MRGRGAAFAAAVAIALAASPAAAQSVAAGLAPFVGTWTINLDRSAMGRAGPGGVQTRRAPTFTWRFTPNTEGLKMEIFAQFPAPAAAKTLLVRADGKQHVCELQESCLGTPGDPKEQTYAFTLSNPNVLVRVFEIRGKPVEYNVYAVSADGKSFVATSWNPETPEFQNVQVFEKRP